MKFNESWLRDWVKPAISADDLLEQLTMAGLEVDGVEPVAPAFTGVVVGEVIECGKHPNADKLSLCQVSDGTATHQVVCGAPNVRAGLRVALARVGAVLPENFKIKKAKLRDIESFGMLCSGAELGISDDADGIVELAERWAVGADLREALDLDDRTVDLDLTPNRGDCLCIKGLAREVGVLNDTEVQWPEASRVEPTTEQTFPVSLADPVGCPRYLGRVISGVDLSQPSPDWMQERLRRCGLRSIDAVVDVTNYVLLELGQPMHAFDLNQLNQEIVVRKAKPKEKLTLLDGQEVSLDEQTLLIADASGPLAIAGVMGGQHSGVSSDTKDVFLECAFFSPIQIAGTARRYGLHTDASHRYERGVDSSLQVNAMERATELLLSIVGGKPGPVMATESVAELPVVQQVSLRLHRLHQLLGVKVEAADVDTAFQRLGFPLVERNENLKDGVVWVIDVPSHRFDISQEADLVEEVCRIYGYNNIPSRKPTATLNLSEVPLLRSSETAVKKQLVAQGFQEVITYSFIDPKLQDLFQPKQAALSLENPMSSELSTMRTSIVPGLVNALRANVVRQATRVRLFEMGLCFLPGEPIAQILRVGGLLWGQRSVERWSNESAGVDFFDAKGEVESLLSFSGLTDVAFRPANNSAYHPGQSAQLLIEGTPVGELGRLHPELERTLELKDVFVFELDGDAMMRLGHRRYAGISKFPSVRRDFSFLVDRSVQAAEVERLLTQSLGEHLIDLKLFDLYEGKGIDSNKKSLSVGLTFQHPSATLTEEEIGNYVDKAVGVLEASIGAQLR